MLVFRLSEEKLAQLTQLFGKKENVSDSPKTPRDWEKRDVVHYTCGKNNNFSSVCLKRKNLHYTKEDLSNNILDWKINWKEFTIHLN